MKKEILKKPPRTKIAGWIISVLFCGAFFLLFFVISEDQNYERMIGSDYRVLLAHQHKMEDKYGYSWSSYSSDLEEKEYEKLKKIAKQKDQKEYEKYRDETKYFRYFINFLIIMATFVVSPYLFFKKRKSEYWPFFRGFIWAFFPLFLIYPVILFPSSVGGYGVILIMFALIVFFGTRFLKNQKN